MAPAPRKSEDEIDKPDPRAPHIILRTLPSLSFSTPTHSIHVQLAFQPPLRNKFLAMNDVADAVVDRRSVNSFGAPKLSNAEPDNSSLSNRLSTSSEKSSNTRLTELEAKFDKIEARMGKIEARMGKIEAKVNKIAKMQKQVDSMQSQMNTMITMLQNLQPPARRQAPSPPQPLSPQPQNQALAPPPFYQVPGPSEASGSSETSGSSEASGSSEESSSSQASGSSQASASTMPQDPTSPSPSQATIPPEVAALSEPPTPHEATTPSEPTTPPEATTPHEATTPPEVSAPPEAVTPPMGAAPSELHALLATSGIGSSGSEPRSSGSGPRSNFSPIMFRTSASPSPPSLDIPVSHGPSDPSALSPSSPVSPSSPNTPSLRSTSSVVSFRDALKDTYNVAKGKTAETFKGLLPRGARSPSTDALPLPDPSVPAQQGEAPQKSERSRTFSFNFAKKKGKNVPPVPPLPQMPQQEDPVAAGPSRQAQTEAPSQGNARAFLGQPIAPDRK